MAMVNYSYIVYLYNPSSEKFEINEDYVDMANLLVKHGFPTNNIKK